MNILLNEEEILEEISSNRKQLPRIDELHFEIWDYSVNNKRLVMSMIYRNPIDKALHMNDYLTIEVAECNTDTEEPIELQTYGRLLKKHLIKQFPDKIISSKLYL